MMSVLASGCGGEPDDVGRAQIEESESGAEQTQSMDEELTDGSPADIEAVLLSVDDLPEEWEEVADDGSGETDSCLDRLTNPGGPFEPSESVNRSFAESALGPFLLSVVTSKPADDVLAATDEVLSSCDGHTTDSGFTSSFESISISGLPPGAIAVRGTEESDEGGSLSLVVAAAGTGSGTVLALGVVPLGEVDEATVGDAVVTMLSRLP